MYEINSKIAVKCFVARYVSGMAKSKKIKLNLNKSERVVQAQHRAATSWVITLECLNIVFHKYLFKLFLDF